MKGNRALQTLCYKAASYLDRNSATILTFIGAVGVVTTAISAVKVTPKAISLIEKAERKNGKDLTKFEVIEVAGPVYIPTVLMGAATISCIFGANVLNRQKQAALTSAYALLNDYHKRYRGKLIELHGKEIDEEVRNEMARERCDFHQIGLEVPDGKCIFYDEISGESIVRYEREIMDAEYHLNRNFVLRGYASLNELYEFLGMPQTEYGDTVGWSMCDGYSWIDFEHRLISRDDGGMEVYAINTIFPPDADYLGDWM